MRRNIVSRSGAQRVPGKWGPVGAPNAGQGVNGVTNGVTNRVTIRVRMHPDTDSDTVKLD